MTDPRLQPLPTARPLTADETRLLREVLNLYGVPGERVDSVAVAAECTCGCPSVGLTDGEATTPAQPPGDHREWVSTGDDGVDVIVHEVGGRLCELEVWRGEPGPVALPRPGSLRRARR